MKHIKTFVPALAALACLSSCELTEHPSSYYDKDTYFNTPSKAKMAVSGAYDCLTRSQHYGQFEMAAQVCDDMEYLKGNDSDNKRYDMANYHINAGNTWLSSLWQYKYSGIDRANLAIDGIENMAGYAEDAELRNYAAQARFLRAFLAFDLVKGWGDVPFKTKYTSVYEETFLPRTNREDIYDVIIADLDYAKENLYAGSASTSPEWPVKAAAHAMLMRVYLQRAGYSLQADGKMTRPTEDLREQYMKAVVAEWEAIQNEGYHGFYDGGYTELFKSFSAMEPNSKESLWEIPFNPTGTAFSDNDGFWGTWNGPEVAEPKVSSTEWGSYMGRANAFFRILPCWKGFFEDGDERRDVLVVDYAYKWDKDKKEHYKNSNAKNPHNWYPGKWRREWMPLGFNHLNATGINYCVLRYADAVLMAAEAYNELGETDKAIELINKVRERAGASEFTLDKYASLYKAPKVYDLPYIDDSSEQGKIRTALYWERGFEMGGEGMRKYDLIRWNCLGPALRLFKTNVTKDFPKVVNYVAGNYFQDGVNELFPFPQEEMEANPKLDGVQNPGF